jgi:hypothetical protein
MEDISRQIGGLMLRPVYILSILHCLLCFACDESQQEIKKQLLTSSNAEESTIYAKKVRELGVHGIPIFNEVISSSIEKQDNLTNYAKLMVSIKHLHEMAKEGIYSKESVPVLLNVIEKQRFIADSLITAEIITIITGLDVGYNLNFVKTYTPSDEPRRKEMILKWRALSTGSKTTS